MIEFTIEHCGSDLRDTEGPWMQFDLQEFLGKLEGYSFVARLGFLDPYGETQIEGEWLTFLIEELNTLHDGVKQGSLEIDIPEVVGTTDAADSTKFFGREGLVWWLSALSRLAERARVQNVPLLAMGD